MYPIVVTHPFHLENSPFDVQHHVHLVPFLPWQPEMEDGTRSPRVRQTNRDEKKYDDNFASVHDGVY
jgi:hypothetical protein